MNAPQYHTAMRRAWVANNVSFGVTFTTLIVGLLVAASLSDRTTVDRFWGQLIGPGPDGEPRHEFRFYAVAFSVIALPVALGGLAYVWADWRFGVRCPHCRKSITIADLPSRRVLLNGQCWRCEAHLFDVDETFLESLRAARRLDALRACTAISVCCLILSYCSLPFEGVRTFGLATSLMCSWLGTGLGLYDSRRHSSRELWVITAVAAVVAVWSAWRLWNTELYKLR